MKRRAKIICTLGPASNTVEKISQLMEEGLNVCRLNMSHGDYDFHRDLINKIRTASKQTKKEVAILMDLQGPKIRVDKLPENLILEKGDHWFIGSSKLQEKSGKDKFIPTVYEKLVDDAEVGAQILFDDGLMEAMVVDKANGLLEVQIIVGGELKSNKGINLPGTKVSAKSFTDKDREDLLFGLEAGVDCLALSFVREAQEIKEVKALLHKYRKNIPIISKIEKPEAVENIDEIIAVTDLIMIARGDMGVEVGNHLVPQIQKDIISKCNAAGVPVITATQMLESMSTNSRPTRAEASDVANAIWDGTDLVMLSGETASGAYPVETVRMMSKIVEEAEQTPKERPLLRHIDLNSVSASLQVAASLIAEKTKAKWVISVTQSGSSCRRMSRFRPKTPVLGISNNINVVRRMCLYWGITPHFFEHKSDELQDLDIETIEHLKAENLVDNDDKVVITRGDGRYFTRRNSNSLKVAIVKDYKKLDGQTSDFNEVEFSRGKIIHDLDVCSSCQSCINICPYDIWTIADDEKRGTVLNASKADACTLDMECVNVCPTGAIEIIPKS